jgi:hypothetical protein
VPLDRKLIAEQFAEAVNMTAAELRDWLTSEKADASAGKAPTGRNPRA